MLWLEEEIPVCYRRLLIGFILPACLHAAANNSAPIHRSSFEKGHQVRYWSSGGNTPVKLRYCGSLETALRERRFALNFAGVSDEVSLSGKRSFKLDLSVMKGNWCYFWTPVAEQRLDAPLYFSGYLYPRQTSNLKVALGICVKYQDGARGNFTLKGARRADGWVCYRAELADEVKRRWLKDHKTFDAEKTCVLGWYISLTGPFAGWEMSGKRVVLYVDEVQISRQRPRELPPGAAPALGGGIRVTSSIFTIDTPRLPRV